MLSQYRPVFVPFALVLVALSGCQADANDTEQPPEPGWTVAHTGAVTAMRIEPGSGDILLVGPDSVARYDATGSRLFEATLDSTTRDAAFTPSGNATLLHDDGGMTELERSGAVVRRGDSIADITPSSIAIGDDGTVHLAGRFDSSSDLAYVQLDEDWNETLQLDIICSGGSVGDVAVDPDSGDVVLLGSFNGILRVPNVALLPGPQGETLFVLRLASSGDARWGRGFLGRGVFEARFDAGDVLIYGLGRAPHTSFGGAGVVHGPFATRLDGANGEHAWTWGVHDESDGARATIDTDGRIVALYSEQVELEAEVEPPAECLDDPVVLPSCGGRPAVYSYERWVRTVTHDGDELGLLTLTASSVDQRYSGILAAAPDGSIVVAEAPPEQPEPMYPSGGFGDPPIEPNPDVTTVTKLRL